jgi:hypothetical protein
VTRELALAAGEVKMLALDGVAVWSVLPAEGLAARAMDEGQTLRLNAQKDGLYTVSMQLKDGSALRYQVRVGAPPALVNPHKPGMATPDDMDPKGIILDLNLEGGIGRHFGDPAKTIGFARARAGITLLGFPTFKSIGLTYEFNNESYAAFGLQAEITHIPSGFWGQFGGMLDTHGKGGGMAAVGFSLVGVEAQYRNYAASDFGFAVFAKLRVPVGVLLYAVRANHDAEAKARKDAEDDARATAKAAKAAAAEPAATAPAPAPAVMAPVPAP